MKKIFFSLFVFLFISIFSVPSFAELTQQQRIDDATQLINLYIHRYAPLTWKEELLGLDFKDLSDELLNRVAIVKSDLEFYETLMHFITGLQDAHVSGFIPSSHISSLGFEADDFSGEVLVTAIDRSLLPEEKFPFQIGDHIIAIDGVPVDVILEKLMTYRTFGHKPANRRLAAMFLTDRPQQLVPFIPPKKTTVTIRSFETGEEKNAELLWNYEGSPLAEFTERNPFASVKASRIAPKTPLKYPFPSLPPEKRWGEIVAANLFPKEPFFPPWENFQLRKTNPFVSGVVEFEGKKVGYIRINTWSFFDTASVIAVINFFAEEISFFTSNTDALIIDQAGNSGGNGCLAELVSGMLVSGPAHGFEWRLKATRPWLITLEEVLNTSKNINKQEAEYLERFIEKIKTALQKGYSLTDPISACSSDGLIAPIVSGGGDRILYTEPILLLINEASCSAGDMFPALLQDAGVVSLGARTAGCGGHIEVAENLGYSDFTAYITGSLLVRPLPTTLPDGRKTRYIENVGVTPDIEYPITADEFRSGYAGYKAAIEETILSLIETR